MDYLPGDVYTVAGRGLFASLIRFFTSRLGGHPERVTHVGLVVQAGTPEQAWVMEALPGGVVRRPFAAGPLKQVHAVYRPPWSGCAIAVDAVIHRALEDEGKKYGWGKVVTSGLDWFLGDRYVFRRLADTGRTGQDCSWSVWDWVQGAEPRPFGVERNCTPADIEEWMRSRWTCLKPMEVT